MGISLLTVAVQVDKRVRSGFRALQSQATRQSLDCDEAEYEEHEEKGVEALLLLEFLTCLRVVGEQFLVAGHVLGLLLFCLLGHPLDVLLLVCGFGLHFRLLNKNYWV